MNGDYTPTFNWTQISHFIPMEKPIGFSFPMFESSKSHTSRADKELESISNLYNLSGIFHLAMIDGITGKRYMAIFYNKA